MKIEFDYSRISPKTVVLLLAWVGSGWMNHPCFRSSFEHQMAGGERQPEGEIEGKGVDKVTWVCEAIS